MPLKAIVSDINAVPEDQRSFYEPKDGKFVLSVETTDGFALENVDGLKGALNAERAAHAAAKNALKPFEGLDPSVVRTAVERAAAFEDLDPKAAKQAIADAARLLKLDPEKEADRLANEKFQRSKDQLVGTFEAEKTTLSANLAEAQAKLTKQEAQLQRLLKSHTISTELVKLNPLDEARDVLEMVAAQSVKLQEINGEMRPIVVDAHGNPRTRVGDAASNYASIPLTVADLMSEIREQRTSLFKPDTTVKGLGTGGTQQARGTGAGTPNNPFAKGSINVTAQVLMQARDPAMAARLKAEAGAA